MNAFIRLVSGLLFFIVLGIALTAVAGWVWDIRILKSFFPGLVAMNPATAVLFIACASAGILTGLPGRMSGLATFTLSAFVVLVSGSRLLGYAYPELNFHFDEMLFSGRLFGNVMAPNTALLFLIASLCLMFSSSGKRMFGLMRTVVEVVALPLSTVSLLGYFYSIHAFYHVRSFIPMALNTALSFLLLTLAILARYPNRGYLFPLLSSGAPGGIVARRLLPAVIGVPILLGVLHLQFRKKGWFDVQTDAALFVVVAIVIFLWLIVVTARVIDRTDQARRSAEDELLRVNENLETLVQERTHELSGVRNKLLQQERLRALGEMSSGIAHDFNNALSPILGYSELIKEDPSILKDTETVLSFINSIHLSAKDAAEIVARMRDFSRRNQEGRKAFATVHLNQIVQDTVRLSQHKWKSQALSRGVQINLCTELIDIQIDGSEAELREMLMNLIFNAVDAMDKDGRITIRLKNAGGLAVMEVIDTGTGMTEEVRRKCLEPFFSTKGEQGTGLGLSMVYSIVTRHNGTIDILSEPGKGTSFVLAFPIGQLSDEARRIKAAAQVRSLRILYVDDDAAVRPVISRYLSQDGHQVETAFDGRMGLARAGAQVFDLIISDYSMPNLTGRDMAAKIRQSRPNTPVILLTGSVGVESEQGVLDAVLRKPVSIQDLRAAIAKLFPM